MGRRPKTDRNAQILEQYARGRTQPSLAKEHGITQQAVSQIIKAYRDEYPIPEKSEEIHRCALLIDALIEETMAVVDLPGQTIPVGKEGELLLDGDGNTVLDHTARLAAIREVRGLLDRKARLLGLDAATKAEVSGEVTYVIPGLDATKLT